MKKKEVIFTDLDGTLLDKGYSYRKAKVALKKIKKEKIPLVICTSKTRAEIESIRKKIGNKDPFISENGGAIFIPKGYFKIKYAHVKKGKYNVIELGTHYRKLIYSLKQLKKKFRRGKLKGFSDMSVSEVIKITGLSRNQARLAKKREYDETIVLKGKAKPGKIRKALQKFNLNYIEGTRFSHIVGNNNKGKAVKILLKLYKKQARKQKPKQKIVSIGIGDGRNDFPMLRNVNKPYLVKNFKGGYIRGASRKFKKAKGVATKGFNEAVMNELE